MLEIYLSWPFWAIANSLPNTFSYGTSSNKCFDQVASGQRVSLCEFRPSPSHITLFIFITMLCGTNNIPWNILVYSLFWFESVGDIL